MREGQVSVIGYGDWGSAVSSVLAEKGVVTVYMRNKHDVIEQNPNIKITNNIADILKSSYVFIVVPAQSIGLICKELMGLSYHARIIICAKGIDLDSGKLLSLIVAKHLPHNNCSILSGPNFALDVRNKLFTCASIASGRLVVAQEIAEKFSTDYFKFVPNDDVVSTQIFSALKNVLAIACGIVSTLGFGDNSRAAIITQGINEMMIIAEAFGGASGSIISPAGIGDIFLSCSSARSRNTAFGSELITKYWANNYEEIIEKHRSTVEGMHTIIAMYKHHKDLITALPIHFFVYEVIAKKHSSVTMLQKRLKKVFHSCFVA